jgi:hypothetical protein
MFVLSRVRTQNRFPFLLHTLWRYCGVFPLARELSGVSLATAAAAKQRSLDIHRHARA